jgi:hypothetical protein
MLAHRRLGARQQGADQAVTGGEVIVEGGDAVAGRCVYGAQRHRLDAALGEQPFGSVHNGLAPRLLAPGFEQARLTFARHNSRLELIT